MLELESEFLCELKAGLETPAHIIGQRVIIYVTGGTVQGPEINGEILPGGGDWITFRPDGTGILDVRALIRTDDGELIYIYYRGIQVIPPKLRAELQTGATVDPSEYYFRTTPVFETSSEKYSWLTRIICVGVGAMEPGGVRYRLYQIL